MTQPIGSYAVQRRSDQPGDCNETPVPTGNAPRLSELAQRALSYAHLDAFFESIGAGKTPDCKGAREANYDYDRCLDANKPVKNPVLFFQQSTDSSRISAADVKQGQAGDCALMATLAALASTPAGRTLIERAIVENKNAQGEVVSYTVTLHEPESFLQRLGLGADRFSEVKVTVDAAPIRGYARARGDGGPDEGHGPHEVWPVVIEKAYAQLRGGYNQTCRGGPPYQAMQILTGQPARQKTLWAFGPTPAQIRADLAAGKLVVLDTKDGIGKAYGLVDGHAYQVLGTEVYNGNVCFKLHNPWNAEEPDLVPCAELTKWFCAVDVGSVK